VRKAIKYFGLEQQAGPPDEQPDPFALPEGNIQVAFSGGRTSAYMLRRLIEANPDWPAERVQVTFQNTGREMPETLNFVRDVEHNFGVPVVWLEYAPDCDPMFRIVDHATASREGEPFEALIRKRKYLPNQNMRFCTEELKIRTAKRYLRWLGWDRWTNTVGIRADEPHRLNKAAPKDRWTVWRPLADAGISKHDVSDFWKAQAFDLALENINGTTPFGNCDGCFLKGEAKIAELIRRYPDRAKWWEKMEDLASNLSAREAATWKKNTDRKEMRYFIDRQGDWIFDEPDLLCQKDEGECMGE
jgi:3'-phosphoadenosine 5'-phosphosulfate sulfotransferase (PAPS reductase)/FAD synthetase